VKTQGNEKMSDHSENDEIARLEKLRAFVVKSRRGGTAKSQEDDVEHIVACQNAIRAIDEALADERKLAAGNVDDFLKATIA
jgi:hypothetical protein